MASDGPQKGQEDFFLLIQTLPTFLAERILNLRNLFFGGGGDPTFLDCQVPRSPHLWISRSPDLQIPRFPGPQISRFPDVAAGTTGTAAGRTLRSQPDPSPNAPRDQIRRKGPCCDLRPRVDSSQAYLFGWSAEVTSTKS